MSIDDNAEAFFQNLNKHTQAIDDGAADFFANLNNTIQSTASYNNSSNLKITLDSKVSSTNQNNKLSRFKIDSSTNNNIPEKKKEQTLVSTEERIVDLLVPDMNVTEVMQLIKKMKAAGKSDSDEFSPPELETKTAPRFTCDYCGNTDQNNFVMDYARGDTICKGKDDNGCGNVVQDHIVHEGSAYRKFEGEEDKSHHGPAPNKLFSSGHNLRTLISMDSATGPMSNNLRRAAEFVEMNLSQMGKDERRTRIGYKDQMKQKACRLIDHTSSNLDLHEVVVSNAKKMFAEFRDLREHVHQFEAVVAGCLLASYLEIGKTLHPGQAGNNNGTIDEKKLHPFKCNKCDRIFNAKRALQFHTCEGLKNKEDKKSKEISPTNKIIIKRKRDDQEEEENKKIEQIDENKPKIIKKDEKDWYKCTICNRMYGHENDFKEHAERHLNQYKKRKFINKNKDMDNTRIAKTNMIVSTNPSVQINKRDEVMFRGLGRRPWLQILKEEQKVEETTKSNIIE